MPRPCVYTVRGGRACGKPGTGNPPLCDAHLAQLLEEDELDELDDDGSTGNETIDAILSHPAAQGILGRLTNLIDRAGDALERNIDNVAQRRPGPPPPGSRRPPPPTATPEDPRVVLGFATNAPLTVELVKERRKQLARIFHLDKGGNDEAMKRVNIAADALIASLSGKKRRPPKP